jgi:hypothetical protein
MHERIEAALFGALCKACRQNAPKSLFCPYKYFTVFEKPCQNSKRRYNLYEAKGGNWNLLIRTDLRNRYTRNTAISTKA